MVRNLFKKSLTDRQQHGKSSGENSGPNIIDKQHGGVYGEGSGPHQRWMSLLTELREERGFTASGCLWFPVSWYERKGGSCIAGRWMWCSEEEGYIQLRCTHCMGGGWATPQPSEVLDSGNLSLEMFVGTCACLSLLESCTWGILKGKESQTGFGQGLPFSLQDAAASGCGLSSSLACILSWF